MNRSNGHTLIYYNDKHSFLQFSCSSNENGWGCVHYIGIDELHKQSKGHKKGIANLTSYIVTQFCHSGFADAQCYLESVHMVPRAIWSYLPIAVDLMGILNITSLPRCIDELCSHYL